MSGPTREMSTSTFRRNVYGTLADIIAGLVQQRDYNREQSHLERLTQRSRREYAGKAEGLEYAIGLLEDWRGQVAPWEPQEVIDAAAEAAWENTRRVYPERYGWGELGEGARDYWRENIAAGLVAVGAIEPEGDDDGIHGTGGGEA